MKSFLYRLIIVMIFLISFASLSFAVTDYTRLIELEILKGDEYGLRLDDVVTRKELAVIIARLMGESTYAENYPVKSIFNDIEDSYYSSYIAWSYSKGYFSNIEGQNFDPDEVVSDIDFEREVLKVLGYDIPEKYINYKAKELDIDIELTDEVTREMMSDSLGKALDVKLKSRNITLYENLMEKRLKKSSNSIKNIEIVSSDDMIIEFTKSIGRDDIKMEIVDKSNPFRKINFKDIEYIGENKYFISLVRMESDKEYYLKYEGINYPFSPKKNSEDNLYIKTVEIIDINRVLVEFSERVTISSARDKDNYGIDGVDIDGINLEPDLKTVVILTEELKNKEYYNFYIENIDSLSGSELEREEFVLVGDKDNDKPNISKVEILSNDLIRIEYSDKSGIDSSSMSNVNNYGLSDDEGKIKIRKISLSESNAFNRSVVLLETDNLVEDKEYTLEVSGVYDNSISKNIIDLRKVKLVQSSWDTYGPKILKVEALAINRINIKLFDDNPIDSTKIFDAGNYHVEGVQITNITLDQDGIYNNENVVSLIIETTNMEKDKEYSIYLDNISDKYGNTVDENSVKFSSKVVDNVSPKISNITIVDKNTIWIKFDEKINRVNCLNTENYVIDNLVGNPNEVYYDNVDDKIILKVSDLDKNKEYLLSVKNIMDYNLNEMGTKSYSFVYDYLNTEYDIKHIEFISSNLIQVDFNSNVESVDNLQLRFRDNQSGETIIFNSIWYREKNRAIVYFKGEKGFKEKTAYTLENVSRLYIEHGVDSTIYFDDSVVGNNQILGYKIFGNNELLVYLSQPFYINEDEMSSDFIDYSINTELNSLNLKFKKSFDKKTMFLNLGFVKSISGKGLYNSNDYSGRYKFVLDFKSENPIDYVEVYNYYNISVFHDTPVFGKYYKIFNISDGKEMEILNIRVDDNNSKKVNILINERLQEEDEYIIKVFNDSQYASEGDSEDFRVDFEQYLVAKVIDNNTVEIYDNYVNSYNISLYKVDSNYKKIGKNLALSNEKTDNKYIVKTGIELLQGSDYLLDYGTSQIFLKGKAPMIESQISVIPNGQYTGKIIVDENKFQGEDAEVYEARLYKVDTMEEIQIYDGIDNQYLIKDPINVGEKVLFRMYEDNDVKYSSQVVIKDGIKDYYQEYFNRLDRYDPETIIDDLVDLSKVTAYFSKEDIKSRNALYYIDNLKVKNEYTIYELYSIIKGVNSYYGSSEKDDVEESIMNLENFTYFLDDDRTISYSVSNYSTMSKELKKKVDKLPNEEKSSYITRIDNIEKRITDSISISKVLVGREKMLNKVNASTYFSPEFYNIKGIKLDKALQDDRVSIKYEWEVLKYEEDKYTYTRDIENIAVQNDRDGVSIIINDEDGTEGIYKIKLTIVESIFGRTTVEIQGEGELIIQ